MAGHSGVLLVSEKGVSGLESGLLIWVLCPLSAGFLAVKAGGFDLAKWAQGVSAALRCLWSVVLSLWRSCRRVLKGAVLAG